ncbi:sulfotransferase family protein [Marinobacter sp. JSM 1782161]|uniref:sulfotransferase family protein n=1 Tax=Marinobacter sp. JSM 1782161 TaxID=2685906 RepID=UPI0014021D79|nr:sulfotransferase [Marinobacter sp. JSM 1782161]
MPRLRSRLKPRSLARSLFCRLPLPGVKRPVFIVGCGRSGTTIFGTALSRHDAVTYLNERRDLWFSAFPETDIWSRKAVRRGGRLCLDEQHADPVRSRKLARLFRFETLRRRRPILVEKLPINNFRLPFIRAAFPDARFIHIYRNGLEVARSIERFKAEKPWFGADGYKWQRLAHFAGSHPDYASLAPHCLSDFQRGLLEWRMSTEAVVDFLATLPPEDFMEISYGELMSRPCETLEWVQDFIGLERDPAVAGFARQALSRRSEPVGGEDFPDELRTLGGPLLPKSMAGFGGLVAGLG